jgi:hypothetical protein
MAVCSRVEDYHGPKMFFSPQAEAFFKEFLGLDPSYVLLQMEAWVTTGLSKSKSPHVLHILTF